ncbi:MAG TPA: hypothetical protein DCR55_11695 [Lentisphaeria bacterium]|nr:hypothetical protein [Lentisphaeria bacterium]
MSRQILMISFLLAAFAVGAAEMTLEGIAGKWKLQQQKPSKAQLWIEQQRLQGGSEEYLQQLQARIEVIEGQLTRDAEIIEIQGTELTVHRFDSAFRFPMKESRRFFLQENAMVFADGGPKRLVKLGKTTMLHVVDADSATKTPKIRYLYRRVAGEQPPAPEPKPQVMPVPEPVAVPEPEPEPVVLPEPIAPEDLSLPPVKEEFQILADAPPAFEVPPAIVDDPLPDAAIPNVPAQDDFELPDPLAELPPPEPLAIDRPEPAAPPATAKERESWTRKSISAMAESEFPDDIGLHWEVINFSERDGYSFVEVAPRPAVMSYDRFVFAISFAVGVPKSPAATYAFEAGAYSLLSTAPNVEDGAFPDILRLW